MLTRILLAAIALMPAAYADLYTITYNGCSSGCGSGPFGTVLVVQGVNLNTVDVTLTLTAGEVFAVTGSGAGVLGFNLDKPFAYVANSLTSGFGTAGSGSYSSGIGTFDNNITCILCGNGTSPPQLSGPVNFSIFNAGGLSPADFVQNSDGYYFASDVGVWNGTGYDTGPVGGDSGPNFSTVTPEPTSVLLLGTAALLIGCLVVWDRRSRSGVWTFSPARKPAAASKR